MMQADEVTYASKECHQELSSLSLPKSRSTKPKVSKSIARVDKQVVELEHRVNHKQDLSASANQQEIANTDIYNISSPAGPAIFKYPTSNSTDALEKCIEWLSHHPTSVSIQQDLTQKLHTKQEILKYRQVAVRQWVDRIQEEEAEVEVEVKPTTNNVVDLLVDENEDETSEDLPDVGVGTTNKGNNEILSNFISSRLQSSSRIQKNAEDDHHHQVDNEASVVYLWLVRHFPLLGRCWKETVQRTKRDAEKGESRIRKSKKDSGGTLKNEDNDKDAEVNDGGQAAIQELSSGEVITNLRDMPYIPVDNNSDEIQRLTNLLRNSHKTTMRSIFSIRKERITPEKQTPPSVFTKVGKQVQGFFMNRLGIRPSRNRNRVSHQNRVNPIIRESRDLRHPNPFGRTDVPISQNQTLHRILQVFFNKKPPMPTDANLTNNNSGRAPSHS